MGLYQKIYQNLFFPLFERGKGRTTSSLYSNSLKSQYQPIAANQERQVAALVKLVDFANNHSLYYQKFFATWGFQPDRLSALDGLLGAPVLTKDLVRENFENLICAPLRDTLWRKSTGGSTGQPLHFGYTPNSYDWRVAMSKRGYSWAGATPGTKQAYVWGVQLGNVSRARQLKESLHHLVDRQKYFNCFQFGPGEMASCLSSLNRWQPEVLVGYTNPLYEFALFVDYNGGPKFRPRSIICGAEKVHPFQREVLEKVFKCPVFNTYGSREFMLIAAECEKHEGLHVSMENLIVEVVDGAGNPVKPGEVGRVLVTDLHNYGMPFIRYEIGDLARLSDRQCSCGRGLMLLDDIVGRSLDVIRAPAGKIIPGEFFPHLFKDFPEIYRFQVVQKKIDLLHIKYQLNAPMPAEGLARLLGEIRGVVGPQMQIDLVPVEDIPLTQTGKYRVTISELG